LEGATVDISFDGVLVQSYLVFPAGTRVQVTLDLQNGSTPLQLEARVLRTLGEDRMAVSVQKLERHGTQSIAGIPSAPDSFSYMIRALGRASGRPVASMNFFLTASVYPTNVQVRCIHGNSSQRLAACHPDAIEEARIHGRRRRYPRPRHRRQRHNVRYGERFLLRRRPVVSPNVSPWFSSVNPTPGFQADANPFPLPIISLGATKTMLSPETAAGR